ncbi:MAG: 5-formyltetrahydrofolate cyclo-ligase [Sphingomonadales bacterium]|nr:5-formyltetrahydrofolate cyclo-ligase [Sphingomonadales bacterium]
MVGPPLTPPSPITTNGLGALRRDMRRVRRTLHNEAKWHPAPFHEVLIGYISKGDVIGLYMPMSGEPDPASLNLGASTVTSLPALNPDGTMEFRLWKPGDATMVSPWGGSQPADVDLVVEPDIIFVPLLAFDEFLYRLGQGGGHYDRYLAGHESALRVGVAWEAQKVAGLPVEPWDVPLDAVITERHCYMKELRPCLTR